MRKVLTYMLAVFTVFAAFGQNPADSTKVYFRIGHRHFDLSLGDNRASMDGFVDKVRKADNIDRLVVRAYASPDGQNNANIRLTHFRCESIADYIIKHSGVSRDLIQSYPEGIAWDELRRMVAANPDVPSREKILDILDNTPVWIFDAKGKVVDGRKKQLMDIDGGKPYRWMFDHIFPQLRNTVAVSLYIADGNNDATANSAATDANVDATQNIYATAATGAVQTAGSTATEGAAQTVGATGKSESDGQSAKSDASETADLSDASGVSEKSGLGQADMLSGATSTAGATSATGVAGSTGTTGVAGATSTTSTADATSAGATDTADAARATDITGSAGSADDTCVPNHRFALKTNLLYYAALMPNLEFEWRINNHWSLAAEGNVAWWNNEPKHKTYRLAMISPEVHYWIRPRAPWHGMFVGLFAGGGWYDLENGGMGVRGEGGMAGLSFGYMWPISRNLSLEAAIGAGYMYTRYKEYEPYEGHYLYMRTKSMNYFGPLKVKFQLVWRFNDINKHKKSAPAL